MTTAHNYAGLFHQILEYLRWLDTLFSGPYPAFSIGILPNFPYLIDVEITPVFGKRLKFG